MSADGYGYGETIDRLNILGYKTKKGNPFGKNSLYDLIRNERYKGTFIFNKRSKADRNNKRNNHKYKHDDEIIRITIKSVYNGSKYNDTCVSGIMLVKF